MRVAFTLLPLRSVPLTSTLRELLRLTAEPSRKVTLPGADDHSTSTDSRVRDNTALISIRQV